MLLFKKRKNACGSSSCLAARILVKETRDSLLLILDSLESQPFLLAFLILASSSSSSSSLKNVDAKFVFSLTALPALQFL